VKSFNHFSHNNDINGVQTIYVDPDPDAADYKIIQLAEQGDIIITQDYGLASLGLAKGVKCCIIKDFATQIKISIACYICVTSARRRDEVANRRKDLNHLQTKTVKHFNNYSSTQFNKPNMATNCAT